MTKTPLMNNPLRDTVRAQNAYRVIVKICEHWRLSDTEKAVMLGLEKDAYRVTMKSGALPATEEMLLRVSDMIAIFRILSTIYYFDHHTIGRTWMKRKNWRAPFYAEQPIEYIRTGYLALESTRRHLEKLITSYGGMATDKNSVIIGCGEIGEILAFNNFMLLQNEDADILAMMLMRVCDAWKLSPEEIVHLTKYKMSDLSEFAQLRSFPEEELIMRWRMILMIHHGLLVLKNGDEDAAYDWMCISNIMLKNGMTPFCVLKNGDVHALYRLLKPLVQSMP